MKNNMIGKRIKFLRTEQELTMHELGQKLGFNGSTADVRICQYESGDRVPKKKILNQLAKALDVSPDTITPPAYDTADGLMHLLFSLDDLYAFCPHYDPKTDTVMLRLGFPLESKLLQKEIKDAALRWSLAYLSVEFGLMDYSDYQYWKHNYPNVDIYELILGNGFSEETVRELVSKIDEIQGHLRNIISDAVENIEDSKKEEDSQED